MSKLSPRRPIEDAGPAVAALVAALEAEPTVRWAYLFGSAARGEAFHDLDVAVSLLPGSLPGTSFGRLVAELERATHGPVDVIDLAHARLPLAARVLREGRVIVDREPDARREFAVDVIRRHLDLKPWLELQDRLLRKRLQEGPWSTGR